MRRGALAGGVTVLAIVALRGSLEAAGRRSAKQGQLGARGGGRGVRRAGRATGASSGSIARPAARHRARAGPEIRRRHDADRLARVQDDQASDDVAPHQVRGLADRRVGRGTDDRAGHQVADRQPGRSFSVRAHATAEVAVGDDAGDVAALDDDQMSTPLVRIAFRASARLAMAVIVLISRDMMS